MSELQFFAYCASRGVSQRKIERYIAMSQQEWYTEHDYKVLVG